MGVGLYRGDTYREESIGARLYRGDTGNRAWELDCTGVTRTGKRA